MVIDISIVDREEQPTPTAVPPVGYKGGTRKGFGFGHLTIGRTPLQTLRSTTTSLQLTTASWIWRPTTPLWKYFVMILRWFGTKRQCLSQRDRIEGPDVGPSIVVTTVKPIWRWVNWMMQRGKATLRLIMMAMLFWRAQGSGRVGMVYSFAWSCGKIRGACVDFPFPLSSILDLLTNCFNAFSSCEMKILEECTIPSSSHGLLAVEPFTYVRFSPPSSRTFVDIHFFSKLNILPSRLTRV